jgi:hypothetical protein
VTERGDCLAKQAVPGDIVRELDKHRVTEGPAYRLRLSILGPSNRDSDLVRTHRNCGCLAGPGDSKGTIPIEYSFTATRQCDMDRIGQSPTTTPNVRLLCCSYARKCQKQQAYPGKCDQASRLSHNH